MPNEYLIPARCRQGIHGVADATTQCVAIQRSLAGCRALAVGRCTATMRTVPAAYSRLRSVLCCCGSLSAYRGALLRTYMPDFLSQTFLGVPAIFGDDRRLTNYAY